MRDLQNCVHEKSFGGKSVEQSLAPKCWMKEKAYLREKIGVAFFRSLNMRYSILRLVPTKKSSLLRKRWGASRGLLSGLPLGALSVRLILNLEGSQPPYIDPL